MKVRLGLLTLIKEYECYFRTTRSTLLTWISFHSFLKIYQPNLYPTVGLQTPGEIVDANFGQQPFVFDIEDYMSEWRAKIHGMIARYPIGERLGEWQAVLQK